MASNKLPPEVLEFFRAHGAAGGKIGGSIGGKTSAGMLTPEQRSEKARKAGLAAAAARRAKNEAAAGTGVEPGKAPPSNRKARQAPAPKADPPAGGEPKRPQGKRSAQ